MSNERRREARVSGSHARYILKAPASEVTCKVVNLSRLGLGVELPDSFGERPWKAGNVVEGTLIINDTRLTSPALVRVARDAFVGLEYEKPSGAFLKALIAMLTPAYVAHSIFEIAQAHLGADVEAVFHGDEFEAVLFKAGRSSGATCQIFVGGEMIEFSKSECRLVPSPLVRSAASPGAYDFIAEFAAFSKAPAGIARLTQALTLLRQVVNLWEGCPPAIRELVDLHHKRLCRKN